MVIMQARRTAKCESDDFKRLYMKRHLIHPPIKMSFDDVYEAISKHPKSQNPELLTTGGMPFSAEAKFTQDRR